MIAAAAMSLSSLSVIGNALRLRRASLRSHRVPRSRGTFSSHAASGPTGPAVGGSVHHPDRRRAAMVAGPHEAIRSALRAHHQVQGPLAGVAGILVQVLGAVSSLAEESG